MLASLVVGLFTLPVMAGPPSTVERWRAAWEQRFETWASRVRELAEPRPTRPLGITFTTWTDPFVPPHEMRPMPRRVVLLVHGLDEPGYIWDDLQRPLLLDGHAVARFEYPNDGAIPRAADLLALELRCLAELGVERVDVVAHSMGGLVSRDLLTRAEHYGGDGRGVGGLPAIERLIMVGTPHRGSAFAAVRGLSEIKERLYRLFTTEGWNLDFDADGDGVAGRDLLPGSDFLTELDTRPPPVHTRMSIIAGRWLPAAGTDLDGLRERLRGGEKPAWLERAPADALGGLASMLDDASTGLGDGVVTLDSARWDAASEFLIVEGNHLTMLMNGSDPQHPPAVPLILERLRP